MKLGQRLKLFSRLLKVLHFFRLTRTFDVGRKQKIYKAYLVILVIQSLSHMLYGSYFFS